MYCIYCQSSKIIKNGKQRGKQRFYCKDCHKTFYLENNNYNIIKEQDNSQDTAQGQNNIQNVMQEQNNESITLEGIISEIEQNSETIQAETQETKKQENLLLKELVKIIYEFILKMILKFLESRYNKRLKKDFNLNMFINRVNEKLYDALIESGIVKEDWKVNSLFYVVVMHFDLVLALEEKESEKSENKQEVKQEVKQELKQKQEVNLANKNGEVVIKNGKVIDINSYQVLDI